MPDRTFLADDQLDSILDAISTSDALPVAMLDQIDAASRDMAAMGQKMAAAAVAGGSWAFLGAPPEDLALRKRMLRPRMKMLLAAFSAGVTHRCQHTAQIRPLMLFCDPPSLVCMQRACMERAQRAMEVAGFRWDNHCDCCGTYTKIVTPYLTACGPLTINGHLCQACTDEMAVTAVQAADEVQVVSSKSPCPCGSGRRYKRCHGREAGR